MFKRILLIQAVLVSAVCSQTSTQTDFVFGNLPSKKELYVSLRQAAMGQQLAGITTDFYTDLFRNPAYLNASDDTKFLTDFGSYNYVPYISVSYPMEYYYYSPDLFLTKKDNSETEPNHLPNSLRIGATGNLPLKLGKYGIFVHGFYQGTTRQINDEYPLNPYSDYTNRGFYLNKSSIKYRYYDLHGFYAISIAGWDAGIDYTYGREINSNDNRNNTEQESYTNNTSNYFHYRTNRYSSTNNAEIDMKTHILRLGAGKSFLERWHADWTLTYERANSDKEQNRYNNQISYDSTRFSDSRTYANNYNYNYHTLRPGNSEADNIQFSINLRQNLSDNLSLVYIAGTDYVSFKADDMYSYLNNDSRLSRQDTFYYRSEEYQFASTLSPSQKGNRYGANLGLGFELKKERYLIAGAIRINGFTGQSEYDQTNFSTYYNTLYQEDTLFNDQRDSLSSLRPVDHKYYHYNIYVPLGCEYKITESFLLRLGVLAHWRYTESKAFKAQYEDKSLNTQINTYYSFGLGYHKNRVGVDFYGEGNLTSLNSWRMALTYKL